MKTKVTFYNDYHNTTATVLAPYSVNLKNWLSAVRFAASNGNLKEQARWNRLKRKLCGVKGCVCGVVCP